MKNFILLLQFFTRIPIKKNVNYDNESYGKATFLLPIIGLIVGFFLYSLGFFLIKLEVSKEIYALAMVIGWIFITGALHIDGFADSIDGILSYRPKEKILEIMRDPHIGTNGVIGIVLLILSKFFLYKELNPLIIMLSFVMGRIAIIFSASFGKYARAKGMALAIIEYNNKRSFLASFIITSLIFSFFKNYYVYVLLTLVFVYFIHVKIVKKIGGVTGDTLGFVCEISEVFFLLLVYLGGINEIFR